MIAALLLLAQLATMPSAAPSPTSVPAATASKVSWSVTHTIAKGAPATTTSAWSSDGGSRLVVRCDTASSPIVSLQFIPKGGFSAASPRPVSINADDNGWFGANWQFPGNGAFISDDMAVTNLAVMVAQAKSIRLRVIAPDNAVIEAVFAGPPGDAPIRAVLSACGYAFGQVPPRSMPKPVPVVAAKPASADDE